MQPGLAAVATRPLRTRSDQPNAGAVGAMVDDPVAAKNSATPASVRCSGAPCGPGYARAAPTSSVSAAAVSSTSSGARAVLGPPQREVVARSTAPDRPEATEAAEQERRPAAQDPRDVDAAGDSKVAPHARCAARRRRQHAAGGHHRDDARTDRRPSSRGVGDRAGQADRACAARNCRTGPVSTASSPAAPAALPTARFASDERTGRPRRRTGVRRRPSMPVRPGKVLHRGLQRRGEHVIGRSLRGAPPARGRHGVTRPAAGSGSDSSRCRGC